MLSFDSIETMEQQIADLARMQPEEQAAWYAERNFESQYQALYRAAEEIEKASNFAEAEAIKAKYTPYFLYNDNPADEEMFNPYLPNEHPAYAYVCNIDGEVSIGGNAVNFNTLKKAEETHEYQLAHAKDTRGVESAQNYLKSTVGDRKFWAEAGLYGTDFANRIVKIEFTSHKKTLLGWNKYATAYFIKVLRYSMWARHEAYFYSTFIQNPNGAWTNEYNSHTLLEVGKPEPYILADMDLYIYSRGTGEAGAGLLRILL